MNEIFTQAHQPIISWKGQTLSQITSSITKNNPTMGDNKRLFFLPPPLKIYRRELVTNDVSCNSNISASISLMETPGSSIVNSSASSCGGLVNTLDNNLTSNRSDIPGNFTATQCVVGTPESNARARVRSSGMVRRKYDTGNNKVNYYTNNKQYLNSRSRSFEQNQYNYIQFGDSTATPGSALSVSNLYKPNTSGNSVCKKHYFASDTSFQYQWFEDLQQNAVDTIFTVDISAGYYDLGDINNVLFSTMANNYHYYTKPDNQTKDHLLEFKLDNLTNTTKIQTTAIAESYVNANFYVKAIELGENDTIIDPSWDTPLDASGIESPRIILFKNSDFTNALGFSFTDTSLSFPTDANAATDAASGETVNVRTFTSNATTSFNSRYPTLTYKPNNYQFAQQGAVSSSSLVTRKKYNTITTAASSYTSSYGLHVANALAYGVPSNGYTEKEKYGYDVPSVPTVDSTGNYKQCRKVTIRGG